LAESRGLLGKSRGLLGSNFFEIPYFTGVQAVCVANYFNYFKKTPQIAFLKANMLKY
jgi:hypothetical protein